MDVWLVYVCLGQCVGVGLFVGFVGIGLVYFYDQQWQFECGCLGIEDVVLYVMYGDVFVGVVDCGKQCDYLLVWVGVQLL